MKTGLDAGHLLTRGARSEEDYPVWIGNPLRCCDIASWPHRGTGRVEHINKKEEELVGSRTQGSELGWSRPPPAWRCGVSSLLKMALSVNLGMKEAGDI